MANSPIPHPTCSDTDVVGDAAKQQQQHHHPASPVNGSMADKAPHRPTTPSNKINVGEDDEMTVIGYVPSALKQFLAVVIVILSAGLAALVFYWKKVRIAFAVG